MIDLYEIEKRYGEKVALKPLTFSFKPNTSYAVIGRNGSGKSTLLKLISKEISPTSGSVLSVGKISFMAQSSYPFDMSVNSFCSLIVGKERLQEFIEFGGFEKLKKTKVKGLSGGEKQRLYLALSIFIDHEILLLDEPTSNLDQEVLREAEKSIAKDNARLKIFATHSISQAKRLADQILFFDNGELVEVLNRENEFTHTKAKTAEFLDL